MSKNQFVGSLKLTCIFCLWAMSVCGQSLDRVESLQPSQKVEREIGGEETHRFKVKLAAEEFFQVRVEQKGIDIVIKFLDESGRQLALMDSPNGTAGIETLSWAANVGGEYEVQIAALEIKAGKGNYTLKRENTRTAAAIDRRRVEIERVFMEGLAARDAGVQTANAIAKFEEALRGWRELQKMI